MTYRDVGIVFIRQSGKTYTKWYSQELSQTRILPFPVSLEEYASKQSLTILNFYHNAFGHDKPIAVVRMK